MALGDFPNSLYWLIVHLSMTLFIILVYKTKSVLVDPPNPHSGQIEGEKWNNWFGHKILIFKIFKHNLIF